MDRETETVGKAFFQIMCYIIAFPLLSFCCQCCIGYRFCVKYFPTTQGVSSFELLARIACFCCCKFKQESRVINDENQNLEEEQDDEESEWLTEQKGCLCCKSKVKVKNPNFKQEQADEEAFGEDEENQNPDESQEEEDKPLQNAAEEDGESEGPEEFD